MDLPKQNNGISRAEYFKNNPEKAKESYKRKYENKKRNKEIYYAIYPEERELRKISDKVEREKTRVECGCGVHTYHAQNQ